MVCHRLLNRRAPADKRPVAAGYVMPVSAGVSPAFRAMDATTRNCMGLSDSLCGLFAVLVAQWGWAVADILPKSDNKTPQSLPTHWPWRGLVAANFLFSFGIVPHTIYWVDFLVRDVGLGMEVAGWHWSIVGLSAFLGPLVTAAIAGRIGVSPTLLIFFTLLGVGVIGPALQWRRYGLSVLWRPARPRVHYGACPKWGPRICRRCE